MQSKISRYSLFFLTIAISVIVGLTVYFVTLQVNINREIKNLDSRVALDLELRMLRLRYFFEAKQTDLSVLADSRELHDYMAGFDKLGDPDYEAVKKHFDGTAPLRGDEFINLYDKAIGWGRSCTNYFTFHDLLIINASGDVIFSVGREADFGSNVASGPYAGTGLGRVFEMVRTGRGFHVSDFEHYAPRDNTVVSFVGIALTNGEQFAGALVVQVPITRIETEIGKRTLSYRQLALHSKKVKYAFHDFDSTGTGDVLTKSIPLAYQDNAGEVLTASIDPESHIQYNRAYSLQVAAVAGLSVLLLGLFAFKVYVRYAHAAVSATNAMIMQSTWASIIDNPEKIGRDFYNNLFQTPALAEVFKKLGHSPDLPRKLVSMMSMIVNHSDRLDTIETEIVKLAGMHVRIGVQPEHIKPFIDAFVKTVEQQYDGDFSPKLRQAWYSLLNEVARIFAEVITRERNKSTGVA